MKNPREFLHLNRKKSFQRLLLLASSLGIMGASVVAYGRVDYRNTINVGGTVSPWISPQGANLTPAAGVTLGFLAAVIGLSLFGVLREAFRHGNEARRTPKPSTSSAHSENEEWEEAPAKKEEEFSQSKT
jgi:hypothetical protein